MSSFTDTKAREKVVDFVDYFKAGTSFFGEGGGCGRRSRTWPACAASACVGRDGHDRKLADRARAPGEASASRRDPRSADTVLSPTPTGTQRQSRARERACAQISMADSPIAAYQVKQSAGAFKLVGQSYGVAPYGIAVPKSDGTLDQAILAALKDLQKNGQYAAILKKWGVQSGADNHPALNGATS